MGVVSTRAEREAIMFERSFASRITAGSVALAVWLAAMALAGCERKERVLDVRTPAADVKVDRNIDNGRVDVQTTRK
jgi:hypothetical protein